MITGHDIIGTLLVVIAMLMSAWLERQGTKNTTKNTRAMPNR
ncbi:MAG: hypothetical protein Q4G13_07545 [Moraxella sp.]|nr:hypothetical protein [Moraxella sp.]